MDTIHLIFLISGRFMSYHSKTITLILASDEYGCIGNGGDLPWHYPKDFKHFKRTTLGHTIVMGRKTAESIGKPLPGRKNVVLTRQKKWKQ